MKRRNPYKYPDPESFRPERWIQAGWPAYKTPLTQYPTIVGMSSFGWGRRSCLGQNIIRDSSFIICSSLLWAFNLSSKRDCHGNVIDASLNESNSLLIVKPDPFEMNFVARHSRRRAEIDKAWRESDARDTADRKEHLVNAAISRLQQPGYH